MEARAHVTSKGQVTIPVGVRRALKIDEGDVVVFELAADYATLRKRRPTAQVVEELRNRYLVGRSPRPITNREAVAEYVTQGRDAMNVGNVAYVSRGDGTFEEGVVPPEASEDAAR